MILHQSYVELFYHFIEVNKMINSTKGAQREKMTVLDHFIDANKMVTNTKYVLQLSAIHFYS